MCGIAVMINLPKGAGNSSDTPILDALEMTKVMVDRLKARGPDDSSIARIGPADTLGPEVILGHTRLAIVGGSEASSPFLWSRRCGGSESRMALIHNGEIYNHKELKAELISEGLCTSNDFLTECDSEVLLASCAVKGVEWTLSNAIGMYAFAIVEWIPVCSSSSDYACSSILRVIVARDMFGIKPLCCASDKGGHRISLASQVAAFESSGFKNSVEVEDIPPGGYVEYTFCDGGICKTVSSDFFTRRRLSPFDSMQQQSYDTRIEKEGPLNDLRERLINAVKRRLPPHNVVKSAVLLSGGLDSSLLASIASHLTPEDVPVYTFNISYEDEVGTDQEYARIVRNYLPNIIHEEVTFTFEDGLNVLPEVIECLETYDPVMIRAGVPLYILSKLIKARGFKVILCGEGADEVFGGYRLFEQFAPNQVQMFSSERLRRLLHIDSSELQRVDRCTAAHGLEARVPFLDIDFVTAAMSFPARDMMSHVSLGIIQKYILRIAFDSKRTSNGLASSSWLPNEVLYREKEQLADGIGRKWIRGIQQHATEHEGIADLEQAEVFLYKRIFADARRSMLCYEPRLALVESRQSRRRIGSVTQAKVGRSQPSRWYPACNDEDVLAMAVTKEDAREFLVSILGWSADQITNFDPSLTTLNALIESMLTSVPFHNLTLLTRDRRPPTPNEIKDDVMCGIGGPCSVVNTFFLALLVSLGFGPNVYLLSCEINGRKDCHVAVLVQMDGLRYFVDVANAKPYMQAIHLGDRSLKKSLNGNFLWNLIFNEATNRIELLHYGKQALSFDPTVTVRFDSFRKMIKRSRSDPSFGPFLTGIRFCIFKKNDDGTLSIKAVRSRHIYDGLSTRDVKVVASQDDIIRFASQNFSQISGFSSIVGHALTILDREHPGWFHQIERARATQCVGHLALILEPMV